MRRSSIARTLRSNSEAIALHDTTSTGSSLVNNVAQSTIVRGKTIGRLRIGAQYSAGGAGDPPDLGAGKIYSDIPIVYNAGDAYSGSFAIEEYTTSHDVDGTIDYDLSMQNNGTITRTTGS